MNKQIITFDANEQSLIKTGGVDKYSSNKVSYIEAHFNLGENWSGYDSVRAVWFTWYECISTVLDTEGICIVPYEVLKRTEKVMVNLVGSISENDVLTDRITTYPIKALEVDDDAKVCGSNTQPITPSEYEQFVEAVKADADRAEEAKEDARGFASSAEISAQNASISETNASTSEDNAKASELNAETYKNQAQTYAQNANNSAISAENAKDEAVDARDTILGMRAEATTLPEGSSATASYNDGVMSFGIPKGDTGATGATGETGATPQLSIGTVETTTEPSVTITGTAENPVLNFGLVKGDKGDTGEVSLADLSTLLPTDTASGSIASFPDGQSVIPALSVVADIEPIQDLHGYDKPWSGGAGKNKLPNTASTSTIQGVTFTVNSDGTIVANGTSTGWTGLVIGTVTLPAGDYILWSGIVSSDFYLETTIGERNYSTGGARQKAFTLEAETSLTVKAYARPNHAINNVTMYPMVLNGNVTDFTYAPYSNICPISGHDEVNVSVCGKNLFSVSIPTQRTWADDSTDAIAMLNSLPIGTYTLTSINTITEVRSGQTPVDRVIGIWPRNTNISAGTLNCRTTLTQAQIVVGNTFTSTITFTIDNDSKGNFTHFFLYSGDDKANVTCTFDIQLEVGTTATTYEPYQGTTYEVSFGTAGTVYGGTVDVVSGVLTVDRVSITVDGTSAITGGLSYQRYYITVPDFTAPAVSAVADIHSNELETTSNSLLHTKDYVVSGGDEGAHHIRFRFDSSIDTVNKAKAFLTSNPLQIVYPLATPQIYQLTPTEVQTLLGQNNIWNDCGDTNVTYKADVTKWVEKQLS